MPNEKNPNHELDLDLIEKYGFLSNNEVDLSKKIFMSAEKVKICNEIVNNLLFTAAQSPNLNGGANQQA